MNTNDEVKFVYLQSGQTPATPDAGTVYFNPITKDISVGDVAFQTLPSASTSDNGKIPIIDAQGNWSLTDYSSNGLPEVTSEDNGDVLQVIEGAWAKGSVPNELPAVTGADDGKVLGVTSGAWGAVDLPSSDNIVYYKLTNTTSDNRRYLADNKTIGDINNDINNGKYVIILSFDELKRYYYTSKVGNKLIFVDMFILSNKGYIEYLETDNIDTRNTLYSYTRIALPLPTSANKILKSTSNNWVISDPELPAVSASDNGNVLAVVNGAWAKSAPESPIAVFSVTFKNPNTQMEMYEHVYWGANDTTHEIVEGVTDYCAELDAAMAEGKAIMIKAYIDDKMFNLVPTSLSYMAGRYTLINNLGQGSGIYYSALNGAWERFKYTKTASSNKDGNFTADIKLSLT